MKLQFLMVFSMVLLLSFSLKLSNLNGQLEEEVHQLHQKISNDLLKVRKEFPKSQPVIYSLLDQVCKIYTISKEKIEEDEKLKKQVDTKNIENKILKTENENLKIEVDGLKKELNNTQQNYTQAAKKLEQKNVLLGFMAREKQKLSTERTRLMEEKNQLLQANKVASQTNSQPEKLRENETQDKTPSETSKQEEQLFSQNMKQRTSNLPDLQSLSLTSTSDPTSPR